MDDWYYKLFGDQFGPVPFQELVELAKSHSLSSDDEVRLGEVGVWRRAGSIGKLMAHLPYQAGKKAISTAASPDDPSIQNSSTSEWSNGDSFETAVVIEPPKVEDRWWCKILDTEMGPMTFDELVDHAKSNTLSSDDEVRFGEKGHWRRAGSIGSLMAHLPFQAGQRVISSNTNPRGNTASKDRRTEDQTPFVADGTNPAPQRPGKLSAETFVVVEPPKVVEPARVAESPKVDTRWWCKIQDLEYGPVNLPKVMEWVASGRLHEYDYVRVGLEPYILAGELPDLFPPKPVSPPKEISAPPVIQRRPIEPPVPTKPVTDSAMSTLVETSPAIASNPERKPYTPAASSMSGSGGFGAASGGMNRPAKPAAVPVRRPATAKSSINVAELLLGPVGLGAGGVVILGLLFYFVLPMLMSSGVSAADIKRFKSLQTAFKSLTDLRKEKDATPEASKQVADKMEKAASKVISELKASKMPKGKGKTRSPQQLLLTFATKMQELAKEDLSKPNSKEMDITTSMGAAAQAMGVK